MKLSSFIKILENKVIIEYQQKQIDKQKISSYYISLSVIFSIIISILPFIYRYYFSHSFFNTDLLSERMGMIITNSLTFFNCCCFLVYFAYVELIFRQTNYKAKLFLSLCSYVKAQKLNLPHFDLNRLPNIKMWLSIRAMIMVIKQSYVRGESIHLQGNQCSFF